MIKKLRNLIHSEIEDYKVLLQNVPPIVLMMFSISVVLMNLLANKEVNFNVSWIAIDCGFTMSWLSFLCMDMLTRRFGAKAAIKVSLFAISVNLFVCGMFYLVSRIPGNWGAYYSYNSEIANQSLNSTFGGSWYVLLGSTIASAMSSVVNALINAGLGKVFTNSTFTTYAIRSYVSTLVAQFLDNLLFALLVSHIFFGWSMLQCITCSITGCIIELLCEVVFSPLGYKVCKLWEAEKVGQVYIEKSKEGGQA